MRALAHATFVVVLMLAVAAGRAGAQISPGPLAKAHAALEGASNCVECHGLRREPMSQRCLACHREVTWLVQRNRGVHAPSRNASQRACASCHPDHAGADFALIDWGAGGSATFEHARAGWPLDGKHPQVRCTACHTAAYRVSPAAALAPHRAATTWIGLETSCRSCHERDDVHRNSLGQSCEQCHDAADWHKPVRFDHEKTAYSLTGKHADVACDKCHKAASLRLRPDAEGRIIGRYKPLPSADCATCHADPHRGRLRAACRDCHTTRDFHEVRRRDFDHNATRYALTGQHANVACEACHGPGLTRRTPTFARCDNCHGDAHFGRATIAGAAVDCAACHRVEGFAPSTFTVAQHAASHYPLAGKHAVVPCDRCHVPTDSVVQRVPRRTRRRVDLHPASASCATCHTDAHPGDVAAGPRARSCAECHTEHGWVPSTFPAARHATLRLALAGAHARARCSAAPAPPRAARVVAAPVATSAAGGHRSAAVVPLHLTAECDGCHLDAHDGRYRAGTTHASAAGCAACHDARQWRPAAMTLERHASLGVPLEGAHRAVACSACHKEFGAQPSPRTLRGPGAHVAALDFDAPPRTACQSCHADPHGGQFAKRAPGGGCERCHDATQWTGAGKFQHNRHTSFPLEGAHSRVPCAACHRRVGQAGGESLLLYRAVPVACEGCHTDAVARKRP